MAIPDYDKGWTTEYPVDSIRFKKKPVVIEAVRVLYTEYVSVNDPSTWDKTFSELPGWLLDAIENETLIPHSKGNTDYLQWTIRTLEGDMNAGPGDWIIRGVKGELYPCKNDIFEQTYQRESYDR